MTNMGKAEREEFAFCKNKQPGLDFSRSVSKLDSGKD